MNGHVDLISVVVVEERHQAWVSAARALASLPREVLSGCTLAATAASGV